VHDSFIHSFIHSLYLSAFAVFNRPTVRTFAFPYRPRGNVKARIVDRQNNMQKTIYLMLVNSVKKRFSLEHSVRALNHTSETAQIIFGEDT